LKKKFLLTDEKKDPQRVLDSIKHNIRKYIKREKRKELPEGTNFWKINCKFGKNEENLLEIRFEDIMKSINEASEQNLESFCIELTSQATKIEPKKKEEVVLEDESELVSNDIEIEENN